MKIFKLTILLLLFFNVCSAHQDFYVTKTFGKVTVKFHTGFHYEEINNVFIIGQYCNLYLKQFTKNTQEILLDFYHDYTEGFTPNYFVNYSRGEWVSFYNEAQSYQYEPEFKKPRLIIRQFAREFDVEETLKLLEYSTKNLEVIKTEQKTIKCKMAYSKIALPTIDTNITKQVIKGVLSQDLQKVIANKVLRTESNNVVNYYSINNEFTVCKGDIVLKKFKKIKHFLPISKNEVLVFPSNYQFFSCNRTLFLE
jgi:hypothetical protein